MKSRIILLFLSLTIVAQAQTNIEKTIPVRPGQKLMLNFDDPELKLQTWDKNEVLIRGTVSINRGENDAAFELQVIPSDTEIKVTATLKDKENIPQRIVIKKGDTEYYFKAKDFNDPEVQKFLEENGREYTYMSSGVIKEIKLEVFVPRNVETMVLSKYGMVEFKNFEAPLSIDAKYGGVDASIVASATGQITARSRYGEILSNLDIKFDQAPLSKGNDHWTEISAKPGTGPRYFIESKYGKVYLRKSN